MLELIWKREGFHGGMFGFCRFAFLIFVLGIVLFFTGLNLTSAQSVGSCGNSLGTTTSITKGAITWTFASPVQHGTFANCDYWVVGPVTITGISPQSTNVNGRTMHGSMINPSPWVLINQNGGNYNSQGIDSAPIPAICCIYNPAMNVARPGGNNLSPANPLFVPVSSSLVSSESNPTPYSQTTSHVLSYEVLTVLGSAPPAGSFRPPYHGTNKNIEFNIDDVNLGLMQSLPSGTTPAYSYDFIKSNLIGSPWISLLGNGGASVIRPHHYAYVTEYCTSLGVIALASQSGDYTLAQKKDLLYKFIQIGIDLYGTLEFTGQQQWGYAFTSTDHHACRKLPILFAGYFLNDFDMLNVEQEYGQFAEDYMTTYINPPVMYNPPYGNYDLAWKNLNSPWQTQQGIPEFLFAGNVNYALSRWFGIGAPLGSPEQPAPYRRCCLSPGWAGIALVVEKLGIQNIWNHNAFLDYVERYMDIEGMVYPYLDDSPPGDSVTFSGINGYERHHDAWVRNMYDTHHGNNYQCGNNILEPGEQCDGGNTVGGDGCNQFCQTEVCTIGAVQNCGTDVGQCSFGQQTCSVDRVWGICLGGTSDVPESCNELDDDCDGTVDNGINCGDPLPIPGRIEAESYFAADDIDSINQGGSSGFLNGVDVGPNPAGGFAVGYIAQGEWLEYVVDITQTGTYNIVVRAASGLSGGMMHVELNGVDVTGPISISSTGDWVAWQDFVRSGVNLNAGINTIRFEFDSSGFNLDYVDFNCVSGCSEPPPPTECSFVDASWGNLNSVEGDSVSLIVNADGDCAGKSVSFDVWERDINLPGDDGNDDPALVDPLNVNFVSVGNGVYRATGNWIAEWQNDCGGLCGDPEYYFVASLVGSSTGITSSQSASGMLSVSQMDVGSGVVSVGLLSSGNVEVMPDGSIIYTVEINCDGGECGDVEVGLRNG
jgi:cysteine-rich repeat protein